MKTSNGILSSTPRGQTLVEEVQFDADVEIREGD